MERGSHAAPYAAEGRYRELYDKQHGLESNLFLAAGEGDVAEAAEANGAVASDADPDMLRLLRDRPV